MNRRKFLRFSAISSLAAAGFGSLAAKAAGSDYRAAVCVFLNGGCDSNSVVVPMDVSGYSNYRSARPGLALPQASLLPIAPRSGGSYGLHPAMPEIQNLFNQGRAAILANVGTLSRPTTKAQAISGSWPLPDNLLSHIDQQNQWSALSPALLSPLAGQSITGWGGRMADALSIRNGGASFPSITSTAGNNIFCDAETVASTAVDFADAFSVPFTGDATVDSARNLALLQLAQAERGLLLQDAAASALASTLSQAIQVQSAFATTLRTAFPKTEIGQQLYRVAQLIGARGSLGLSRQVFYVELGGFDTHADQRATLQNLLGQLSQALSAFYAATVELGVVQNVTTFTHSEFSRTLKPAGENGGGTDHAWGGHSFILGGAVNGGELYGTFPQLTLNGPDDVTDWQSCARPCDLAFGTPGESSFWPFRRSASRSSP